MTIQDVGSIGELIAAVATVATLAYLALQIRQNNRSNQLVAIARLAEASENWLGQIVQNDELYDIYRRGMRGSDSLSTQERGRFDMLVVQMLRSVESGWFQVEWGLVDPDYWDGFMGSVNQIVGSDGGRRAFANNQKVFAPNFVAAIQAALDREDAKKLAEGASEGG